MDKIFESEKEAVAPKGSVSHEIVDCKTTSSENSKIFLVKVKMPKGEKQLIYYTDWIGEVELTPQEVELLKEDLTFLLDNHFRTQDLERKNLLKKLESVK